MRKAGNRVRITAQLIEAASDTHLWAQRWDRDLDDIFALQDEISQAIGAALKIKLLPAEKKAIARRGADSSQAVLGERDKARQWIDRALLLDPDNHLMRYNFACALSLHLGDADGAIALLEAALAKDADNLESARTDPDLEPLRGDPRFEAVIAQAEARLAAAKSADGAGA